MLILFDGGLNTSVEVFRRAAAPASMLATAAVVLTALLVAAVGLLLGLSPSIAVLVGVVVSSTDAAAVFTRLPCPAEPEGVKRQHALCKPWL